MRKKIMKLLLIVFILSLVSACSNEKANQEDAETNAEEEVEETIDAEFIEDMEKATKARWDLVNKYEEEEKEDESFDADKDFKKRNEFIEAESEILYKYEELKFKDPKLKKLAMDYIEGVRNQEKSLEYYYGDEMKYYDMWDEGIGQRSIALTKLVDDYGLKTDEETMKGLRQTAQVMEEEKELRNQIEELSKTVEFKLENDSSSYKEYIAIVENTTDMEFEYFYFDIKLIDEDGVTVDTTQANTSNWEPGEKVRFEFSTDKTFDEIKWQWGYSTD